MAEASLRYGTTFRLLSFVLLLILAWFLGQEGVPVEDGPELLTVARLGGTNHSPGMPLLSLLCRVSWILLGEGGLRVLFALMAAASLWLLSDGRGLPGLLLAVGILLLPVTRERLLLWDAYGPLFLLFALAWRLRGGSSLLMGYLTGLALTVHPLGILLPAVYASRESKPLRLAAGVALGLSLYLALPLYSAAGAVVDWGSPSDLGHFMRQVSAGGYREVYGSAMGRGAISPLLAHLNGLWRMLWPALGVASAIGLAALLRRFRRPVWRLLALGGGECLFVWLVNPMAAGTSQTGVLSLFTLAALAMSAPALLPRFAALLLGAAVALSGAFGKDPLTDQRPRVEAALAEAPPDAVFVLSDNDLLYGCWQLKYAEDRRPDAVLLSTGNFSGWFEDMVNHFNPDMDLSTGVEDIGGAGLSREEASNRLVNAARVLNPERSFLTDAVTGK